MIINCCNNHYCNFIYIHIFSTNQKANNFIKVTPKGISQTVASFIQKSDIIYTKITDKKSERWKEHGVQRIFCAI